MKKFSQLAFPYIVWAVLMLVFPMVLIALYSVTDQGNTILSFTFTLEHYAKFFTDPDFLLILWRSVLHAEVEMNMYVIHWGSIRLFAISQNNHK